MTAPDILEELTRILPEFRSCWDGENLFRDDDGSFTACGVFSHFTDFFRERHAKMKREELEAVAALIERCGRDKSLAEAAYTCFLENIAGDPPDATLTPYLPVEAIVFLSHWRRR